MTPTTPRAEVEKVAVLSDELAQAEARVDQLRRRVAASSCREVGCDMRFMGGCNAGCDDGCNCSVPVHQCIRCGDCDYGDNPEANETRAQCAEGKPSWEMLG